MTDALDIKSRTMSLNDKITYAADVSLHLIPPLLHAQRVSQVQSVLRELLTEVNAALCFTLSTIA